MPGGVPGIAPSRYPPGTHPATTPGTPTTVPGMATGACSGSAARRNSVVGLISVAQLTLSHEISGSQGMTEVYNLLRIDRIINHSFIVGNK